MAEHTATIHWKLGDGDFLKGKYSREHVWKFDGGAEIAASPSPHVVPVPWSDPALVDPEEAFVASLASCHMLTFLYVASRQGFLIESYEDHAVGIMAKNEKGVPWVSKVTLQPRIVWAGEKKPSDEEKARLHHLAHEQCFIANSVRTEVIVSGEN